MSNLRPGAGQRGLTISSQSELVPGSFPSADETLSPNTSTQISLAQAVHARRAEYTKPRTTRIKIGSWNVAAHKSASQDLGEWIVNGKGISEHLSGYQHDDGANGQTEVESVDAQEARHKKKRPTVPKNDLGADARGEDIGIYAIGLQEVVDINSAVEALRPYSDDAPSKRFKKSMEAALPPGYQLVGEQQLIGLLLLVYASPDMAPLVHSVSMTSVGTGLMGYMGNKGSVACRIVVGELNRLVFVNSHLGAGKGPAEVARRNWDVEQIVNRTRFDPIVDGLGIVQEQGERIGEEDHAFWFGDLNYRLEGIPPEDVRKILMLHVRDEYDIGRRSDDSRSHHFPHFSSSKSSDPASNRESVDDSQSDLSGHTKTTASNRDDPASLQATLDSLLAHDELRSARKKGQAFPDWNEGPITFLPTYKYDVGSVGTFDSGEKKRGPSWCDRILYRSRKDRLEYEEKLRLRKQAQQRDTEMQKQGVDTAADDENTMFEYDPEQDADDEYDASPSAPEDAHNPDQDPTVEDELVFESYNSHQRVISADHKPLDAVFTLKFDAAVPELKSRVQQEVARELDKLENEGQPVLTVVVDGSMHGDDPNFTGINFGEIRYDDPKSCIVTLANTGRVPALFGFVSRPQQSNENEEPSTAPKWLSISLSIPSENESVPSKNKTTSDDAWDADVDKVFRLEPGATANVDLLSYVKDRDLLRKFNDDETMEDIMILRVRHGRDHFLPVRGTWHKTVHGRTLDALSRIPEGGIRALQNQKPEGSQSRDRSRSGGESRDKQAVRWSAPREIFRLTEAIETLTERVLAEWSMLGPEADSLPQPPWIRYAGWPFVEESWTLDAPVRQSLRRDVNEALDTGQPLDNLTSPRLPPLHRLEALVDVLLDFLGNLEDGVIPAEVWKSLETNVFAAKGKSLGKTGPSDLKTMALEILSSARAHSVSFILLTSMLARTSQEVASAMTVPGLAQASPARTSAELPSSPKVIVRRKTLDKDTAVASKQLMLKNIVAVFADVMISVPPEQSPDATENTRRELIEMFMSPDSG